jgi:hypothetical protein
MAPILATKRAFELALKTDRRTFAKRQGDPAAWLMLSSGKLLPLWTVGDVQEAKK